MSMFNRLKSTVGRKALMAVSGIALMLFLIVHLAGNLTLFFGHGELFNSYAYHLESLPPVVYTAEFFLAAIFIYHIVTAIQIQLGGSDARGSRYEVVATKGGPSKQTLASKSMIYTGIAIGVFLPLHIVMFKFNWFHPHGIAKLHGSEVKDLYATVVNHFKAPGWTFGYVAVMLFLGFHLRHGFWSSLQSLGAMNPKISPLVHAGGLIFAALMAGAFLVLPVFIYINADGLLNAASAAVAGGVR
jgi:succinate dehydrogenase / fumarate reductase cytochrome b subunit